LGGNSNIWGGDFYASLPQSGAAGPLTAASLAPGFQPEPIAAKTGTIITNVTSAVQAAVDQGKKTIGFVISGHDPVWPETVFFRRCMSYYFAFNLKVDFQP